MCVNCHHHEPKEVVKKRKKKKIERMEPVCVKMPVWWITKIKARAEKEGVHYSKIMRDKLMLCRGQGRPLKHEPLKRDME